MKQWKRLLSLVLAASLVFSMGIVLPEVQADSSSAPVETTWDCSSADGWTLANGFALEDGKLVWRAGLNTTAGAHGTAYGQYAGNKTIVSDAAATGWTNYSVSVDITSTYNGSTHAVNGTALNQFAYGGINFYVSDTDWVQVRVQPGNTLNKYGLTVYENSTGNALTSGNVTVGTDGSVEKTFRAYNVKAELTADGKLVVYINGEKVKELTVSLPAGGAPALMAWPSSTSATTQDTVTFDNVQIKPLAAPVVAPTPDYNGTLLGWSDGSADLGEDWTVTGTVAAADGVLKATTADNFFAKVGSAVQHGYIEADITMPAKSDFTATANKNFGYINATVGNKQVYTLRLFWQQKSGSSTLHDGKLYADLFIDDSVKGYDQGEDVPHYGGAGQGTRVSFNLSDAHWGKTYTLRLARIGNFVEAKLIDKETSAVLKTWQYALNPAYSIVTGAVTFGFGSDLKDSGCNVIFDNIIAASIAANEVSVGELDMTIDAYGEITKGLDDAAQKIDSFYRTAYAPDETVTVKLKSAADWNLETLRYVTATNTAGTKLVATADDTVYTFVMPAEAVTIACDSVDGPADEILYTNDGTAALDTDLWASAVPLTGNKLVLVTDMDTKNANKTVYFGTAVTDGWIKADITLPTITVDQMVANNGATGNIGVGDTANLFYGFYMQDATNTGNAIEAAIFYQRNAGTSAAAQYSKLRVRVTGSGYNATNIAEVKLPNEIWDSSKSVTLKLRTVGNYIEAILIADGVEYVAAGTAAATTVAGDNTTAWKFGLYNNVGMLYTDTSKVTKLDRTASYSNIEIGQINKVVTVNIDADAADKVSLPAVNEIGKTTALDRTGYQVGEVLKLTVADDADLSYLHYTIDENSERVDIAAPDAFAVPDAETVNIAYGKAQEIANQVLYTNDGTAALDTDLWASAVPLTGNKLVLVTDMDTKNANKTVYFGTAVTDGWIKADITLPTITVDQMVANNGATGNIGVGDTANLFYGFYMQDATNTGNAIEAAIFYQRNAGTSAAAQYSKLRVRVTGSGYNATNIAEVKLPNEIWNSSKSVTLMLRTVGNYIEAILIADGVEYVAAGTAAATTVAGDNTTAWKFGLYNNVGMLYTDTSKVTKLDRTASFSNIEIGQIKKVVTVNIDADAADKVSLPKVNEIGKATTLDRTGYQVGEVLELTVADGANAANLKYITAENTEGVAITAADAFEVPNEDAITIVYSAPSQPGLPEASTVVATADGSAALDADIWAITNAPVVENGVITSVAGNTVVLTKLAYQHASVVAEITLPATHSLTANTTVASVVARINTNQEHVARFQYSKSSGNLQIGMLVRDEVNMSNTTDNPHYGGGGQGVSRGTNHNDAWGKTYIVEVVRIGNLVQIIFTDKETNTVVESWTYNLNPNYEVTTTPMYLGFTAGMAGVVIDNVVVTSYDAHSVSVGELSATVDETPEIAKGMDGSELDRFSRTHYAAGELVTVMLNNTTGLDLTTLRYVTASNTEGVALTATAVPGIYTFLMPQEDVTLVCDEIVITEPSEVVAEINGDANLDTDLWTVTGAYTADGTISTTGSFKAVLDGKYQHFTMEADIVMPAKPADLPTDSNVTFAAMTATVGSNQYYQARFFWQGKANTYCFDLVLIDSNTAYQPSIYGGAGDGGRLSTALTDAHWGKTFTVKVSRIGNRLAYSVVETGTDNVIVDAYYNLNPNYTITTGQVAFDLTADGSKGAVAFDNVKITSYNVRAVDKGELAVSLDSAKEHTGGKDASGIETFDRTAYAAGETVTVLVKDPTGMDLASLRYVSASNPTGTTLTATSDPLVFTFVMPNENVTLAVDEGEGLPIVPKPEGQILKENFDTVADGTASDRIFKDMDVKSGASNAKAKDGALVLNSGFGMQTKDTYLHGHIEADFTFVKPQAGLENATATTTKYGGNLSAKWSGVGTGSYELRTRFMVTRTPGAEQEYTVKLQIILYSIKEYGNAPIYGSDIPLTNFQWGNTYNVKLTVIGNYFTVHVDGALAASYMLDPESQIANYAGYFGVAHVGDTFELAMDNIEIQSYKAYAVSFDNTMADVLATDAYGAIKGGKVTPRTHFLENEFVKLHVSAPAGYGIDDATIKYTGATCGDVAITAKDSAILYGFRMPAEDVTVTASLTEAETDTKPINDTFDTESLMVDRGWGKEFKILDGKARAYGYTESYLSGIAGVNSWKSYTVSAKITMVETTSSSTGVAALCVRTESTAEGYEYGLTFNAGADKGALRLYDRANGKLLYTGEKELNAGVEYTLTLVVKGSQISGYLNGAWRFTVYVEDTVGGVGVRAQSVNAIFDDVKVTDIVA